MSVPDPPSNPLDPAAAPAEPIPAGAGSDSRCDPRRKKRARNIALPVLPPEQAHRIGGHPTKIARSRVGRWRAIVLVGVHVVFALHIGLWLLYGLTLSPIEPSETMYALEQGLVNAGFIFFILAIASTLIFGRFFCGWGCHIVALQDACSWFMTRLGVRPKPFRSRLLVYVPLALALYMFVWPTFKREVVAPLAGPERWEYLRRYLGDTAPFPGFTDHLFVTGFWDTFAPWYIAIPFLGICGFATVYFLGSKAFCTYGCPYGGFFAPADAVAPGRIRVTDACQGCGHCTAICSSNVRVHEEVRDYGMVVDPGCMKCLDCVSVCPNDALYFGFGAPRVLARPCDDEARARRKRWKPNYDLTRVQELLVAVLFLAVLIGYRGMFNSVPLLMAVGIAGIGAFSGWKLLSLVRTPNVRLQSLQLKHRGRLKPAGWIFAPLAALLVAGGAWGLLVKSYVWRAEQTEWGVTVPQEVAFAPGYVPDPEVKAIAERAIALFTRAGPPSEGGIGWDHNGERRVRLAYLNMVAGDAAAAEFHLRKALAAGKPADHLVFGLGDILALRGVPQAEIFAEYRTLLNRWPHLHEVRFLLAQQELAAGRSDDAIALYEAPLADTFLRWDARLHINAAAVFFATGRDDRAMDLIERAVKLAHGHTRDEDIRAAAVTLAQRGRMDRAEEILRAQLEARPRSAVLHEALGSLHAARGRADEALASLRRAADLDATNPFRWAQLAAALASAGKPAEAIPAAVKAAELAPQNPNFTHAVAQLHAQQGQFAEATTWAIRTAELAPTSPEAAAFCAQVHAAAGNAEQAQRWTAEAQRRARSMPAQPR